MQRNFTNVIQVWTQTIGPLIQLPLDLVNYLVTSPNNIEIWINNRRKVKIKAEFLLEYQKYSILNTSTHQHHLIIRTPSRLHALGQWRTSLDQCQSTVSGGGVVTDRFMGLGGALHRWSLRVTERRNKDRDTQWNVSQSKVVGSPSS